MTGRDVPVGLRVSAQSTTGPQVSAQASAYTDAPGRAQTPPLTPEAGNSPAHIAGEAVSSREQRPADSVSTPAALRPVADSFLLDDRMALLEWVSRPNRSHYYYVQRAMERARSSYHRLVAAADLTAMIGELAGEDAGCPHEVDVDHIAEQLVHLKVFSSSHDGARATSIAEYRRRLTVYSFTPMGFVAYRGFEQLLAARPEEASLSPLGFADLHADLLALAEANTRGDEREVFRKLARLDRALTDMAEHGARFHVLLADIAHTSDGTHEAFLAHKDALLSHLRDFHDELTRYAPRIRAAVETAAASGTERLVEAAARGDDRPLLDLEHKRIDWRERWAGLRAWFSVGTGQAARLDQQTVTAIHDVIAMLRRLTDNTVRGVSRETQLRYLAGWFAACPDQPTAQALFGAAFNWSRARHLGADYADPEAIPNRTSWWVAPDLGLHKSLWHAGRQPGAGRASRISRNTAARNQLRQVQLAEERARLAAARALARLDVHVAVLDAGQTAVLLRLLDHALGTRAKVPVSGRHLASASDVGVRLTLHPHATPTVVRTHAGRLLLDGFRLELSPVDRAVPGGGPRLSARGRRAPGTGVAPRGEQGARR